MLLNPLRYFGVAHDTLYDTSSTNGFGVSDGRGECETASRSFFPGFAVSFGYAFQFELENHWTV